MGFLQAIIIGTMFGKLIEKAIYKMKKNSSPTDRKIDSLKFSHLAILLLLVTVIKYFIKGSF